MLQLFDERNRDLIVNVGGALTHRDQAAVSPFDSVVQGGDAVWEGLRLHAGKIFRLDEHLARLRASARALAFGQIPSDEEITEQIRRTLAANGMRDGVHIRLTLTRGVKLTSGMDPRLNQSGPTLIVLAEFKEPVYDAGGITLITASVRRPAPDCLDPKIHHNNLLPSIMAKIEANVAGADDAVMLDHRGFIAETNATHIFMVTGGRLATPTTVSCPEGITRAAVLELAAAAGIGCETGDYTLPKLYTAAEVASSRTAALVMPSGHDTVVGVASVPPVTMKRCVALVSAMKPRWSSITASSAPATFASILARIDGSRLLWWIFGSRQSGGGRRTLEVMRVIPARSYTGGLCSASTIRVGPDRLSRGSIPLVTFSPRVSVSLMCTLSVIWLARRVRRTCSVISSSEGTVSNASAFAERRNRARCSASRKMRPRYRRRPSQTATPPCRAATLSGKACASTTGAPSG